VLVWINGPFGVGKTTTAQQIRQSDRLWRIFDPEWVGYMLRANLAGVAFDDFQDLPAWRVLVPAVAHEVMKHTDDDLIAVQTVLNEHYWRELRAGLAEREITLIHVVLDADSETLRERIVADWNETTAATWRLDHISAYLAARAWLLADADLFIDAATASPKAIAQAILGALH
jgi:shikimate kinase